MTDATSSNQTIAQCCRWTGLLTLKWEVIYCMLEHAVFPIQRDICGGQDHENLADVIALRIRPWAPNCSWPTGSVISSTVNGYIQSYSAKLARVLLPRKHDGPSSHRTDGCIPLLAEWNRSKCILCSKSASFICSHNDFLWKFALRCQFLIFCWEFGIFQRIEIHCVSYKPSESKWMHYLSRKTPDFGIKVVKKKLKIKIETKTH